MSDADHHSPFAKVPTAQHRLRLYVAGPTPRSVAALRNLERICQAHLPGWHHIEVIDLMKNPHLAMADNILAVPTLVQTDPAPVRKIVGNLSNPQRVLAGLGLPASGVEPAASREGGKHV